MWKAFFCNHSKFQGRDGNAVLKTYMYLHVLSVFYSFIYSFRGFAYNSFTQLLLYDTKHFLCINEFLCHSADFLVFVYPFFCLFVCLRINFLSCLPGSLHI